MKTIDVKTFTEFVERASSQLKEYEARRGREARNQPVLFRGQSDATWKLTTTLERYTKTTYSPKNYHRTMTLIRSAVESYSGKRWDFAAEYTHNDEISQSPQDYSVMIHLRHHGFPSPLLDWTRSLYIAAFFAFQDARTEKNDAMAAIYSYIEYPGGWGKSGWEDHAAIVSCGPNVTTHKRHHIQQSEYTFCSKLSADSGRTYCSHEEAFGRNDERQDVLTKFVIPCSERSVILDRLETMNITAHTLFGDEESLLKTLAYREIERRNRDESII